MKKLFFSVILTVTILFSCTIPILSNYILNPYAGDKAVDAGNEKAARIAGWLTAEYGNPDFNKINELAETEKKESSKYVQAYRNAKTPNAKEKAATRYRDDKAAQEEWMKEFGVAFPENLASKINISAIDNPYAGNQSVDAGNKAAALEARWIIGEDPDPHFQEISDLRNVAKYSPPSFVKALREVDTPEEREEIISRYRTRLAEKLYLEPLLEGEEMEFQRREQKMSDAATIDSYISRLSIYFAPDKRNIRLSESEKREMIAITEQFIAGIDSGKFDSRDISRVKMCLSTIDDRLPDYDVPGHGLICAINQNIGINRFDLYLYIVVGLIPIGFLLLYGAYSECFFSRTRGRKKNYYRRIDVRPFNCVGNSRKQAIAEPIIIKDKTENFVSDAKSFNDHSISTISPAVPAVIVTPDKTASEKNQHLSKSEKRKVFIIIAAIVIVAIVLVYSFFYLLFGDDAPVKFGGAAIKSLFVIGLGALWGFISTKIEDATGGDLYKAMQERDGKEELLGAIDAYGNAELLDMRDKYIHSPSPSLFVKLEIAFFKQIALDQNVESAYRTAGELGLSYEEITAIAKSFDSDIDDDAAHRIWEEAYSKRGEKTNN